MSHATRHGSARVSDRHTSSPPTVSVLQNVKPSGVQHWTEIKKSDTLWGSLTRLGPSLITIVAKELLNCHWQLLDRWPRRQSIIISQNLKLLCHEGVNVVKRYIETCPAIKLSAHKGHFAYNAATNSDSLAIMSFTSFATFVAPSLRNALGVPSTKIPIDGTTFVLYVLPTVVCKFVVALLAVTPQTRTARVALRPLIVLFALRAALSVDMSLGRPERKYLNIDMVVSVFRHNSLQASLEDRLTWGSFQLFMFSFVTRTLDWTLAKEPLVRHLRPANSSPSAIMDALDLVSNYRGHGWEWSRGLYIPRETRPTTRMAFVYYTFVSAVAHALICGALHRAVLSLAPLGGGPIPGGSTIFDVTLPFLVQYLRASIISILATLEIYASVQMYYDLATIPAVLVLGQDPSQWPPLFDSPWRATSLSNFWGRRWHQFFRHTFLVSGGHPFSFVLGRTGFIIGAFLASAVLHHILLVALNSRAEIWWMLVGFGMMGPGILAERTFHQLTGRRVGGVVGWVWTVSWLLLWGNVIVEGFARAGLLGRASFVESLLPVRISLEDLVVDFDDWLHTI